MHGFDPVAAVQLGGGAEDVGVALPDAAAPALGALQDVAGTVFDRKNVSTFAVEDEDDDLVPKSNL